MSSSRLAVLAAVTALLAWGVKSVAIGAAGGLDQSPLEGPLFLLGLLALLACFAALGVSATAGRPTVVRVLAGLAGAALALLLTIVGSTLSEALVPASAGWVRAEAGLWVCALLALAASVWWRTRRSVAVAA